MTEPAKGYVEENTISEMFFKSNGRLNRLRYFKRRLVLGVLLYVFIYLGYRVIGYEFGQENFYASTYNTVVSLIFVIPTYFLNVRRLQDMNRGRTLAVVYAILTSVMAFLDFTGINYMLYISLILVTMVFMISGYMLIAPGTNGKNRYGLSPI
ncbi:MAG: DUF805 domain-containing protein [Selenomonadaceae bacterium]|nr:DUF805 domain-containing protein [Selenomonadaceae bacterium]